jgi:hypothetical protein
MRSLQLLIQSGEVCQCMRAKTLYYDKDPNDDDTGGPFWCALTQLPLGPDNGIVDVDRCRRGRSCCKEEA